MKRKIYDDLLQWKTSSAGKTALLIDGARRVGKSYIVEQFAKAEYKTYIVIDFYRASQEVKDLFTHYLNDLDAFFMYLSVLYNVKLHERKSLIVFDEVQMFPRARGAIKYLVADGRYDFVETGSLMSIKKNVEDIMIPSEERHIEMYPMDFEEFLWAIGNDTLMPFARQRFEEKKPLGQAMHRKAMDQFRQYLIVGGMPQAVQTYVETRDFDQVDQVKRDILTLYRADIAKHAAGSEMKVFAIFDDIPAQLSKHEKKFKFSSLKKNARSRDYDDAMFWLFDAMIANPCYNSTEPNIGLKLNRERTTLKCYSRGEDVLLGVVALAVDDLPPDAELTIISSKLQRHIGGDSHIPVQTVGVNPDIHTGLIHPIPSIGGSEDKRDRLEYPHLLGISAGLGQLLPALGVGCSCHAELSKGGPYRRLGGVGKLLFGQAGEDRVLFQIQLQKGLHTVLGVAVGKGPRRGGADTVLSSDRQHLVGVVQTVVDAVGRPGQTVVGGVGVVAGSEGGSHRGNEIVVPHAQGHGAGFRAIRNGRSLGRNAHAEDGADYQHQSQQPLFQVMLHIVLLQGKI